MSALHVTTSCGKYTVICDSAGMRALRYGEPRRGLSGDKLVYMLTQDLADERERAHKAEARVKLLEAEVAQNNAAAVTFDLCCCKADLDKALTALRAIATYDEQSIWDDDRDDAADGMLELARTTLKEVTHA